jgi:hypothetical protein
VNVALEIAMYQWQEGQQRMREADPADQGRLDTAMYAVLDELRHRLGSTFEIAELADLYTGGTDWAEEIAQRRWAAADAVAVVDAAFARYAREASDFAGGRRYARDSS